MFSVPKPSSPSDSVPSARVEQLADAPPELRRGTAASPAEPSRLRVGHSALGPRSGSNAAPPSPRHRRDSRPVRERVSRRAIGPGGRATGEPRQRQCSQCSQRSQRQTSVDYAPTRGAEVCKACAKVSKCGAAPEPRLSREAPRVAAGEHPAVGVASAATAACTPCSATSSSATSRSSPS